jgi:hypothetical protein
MPDSPIDPVRSLVVGHGSACLLELEQSAAIPRAEATLQQGTRWALLVLALPVPAGQGIPGLTECDRDCLALLARSNEPLSAARVRRELERGTGGVYAEITVKRSLTRLKRLGIVCNSRRRPRGYFLPEALPLLRHIA